MGVTDDVVGGLLFLEEETASRYAMLQRDGADAYGTVVVDDFGLAGVDGMESDFVSHSLAEKLQLWSQQSFQFLVGIDVESSCTA